VFALFLPNFATVECELLNQKEEKKEKRTGHPGRVDLEWITS
jgi:hypothetical protein